MGLIAMLIVHIGWAKPVPVNPNNNFKETMKCNSNISIIMVNSIISIICVIIKCINMYAITEITSAIIIYNVSFAAFNLLPIPPLDGWGVISSFIPYKYNEIAYINKYGSMIFLIFILTGAYSIFVSNK